MATLSRRTLLALSPLAFSPSLLYSQEQTAAKRQLPMSTIFKGEDRFQTIVKKAQSEDWKAIPIGKRIIKFAEELRGTPYESFTLEIDDHIESPSVNLDGVDCWTFFEACLGMARMVGSEKSTYTPADLLREIEFTRYRGGQCSGDYLERIHYLAEWFFENDARGTCEHLTPDLPGAERIHDRKISEMTTLWKYYRYLKNNPDLLGEMKEWEDYVAALPVYHIPKSKVAGIESKLQSGDVIGIATKYNGGFCSHVGLINRTSDGVARFMHASRDYKKVVVDDSISEYLNRYSKHAGILVGRPLEVSETITDESTYKANLKNLVG